MVTWATLNIKMLRDLTRSFVEKKEFYESVFSTELSLSILKFLLQGGYFESFPRKGR